MFHWFINVAEKIECNIYNTAMLLSEYLDKLEAKFYEYFPSEDDPRARFLSIMGPFIYSGSKTNMLSLSSQRRIVSFNQQAIRH